MQWQEQQAKVMHTCMASATSGSMKPSSAQYPILHPRVMLSPAMLQQPGWHVHGE